MSDSSDKLSKAARIRQERLDRWRRPLETPWDRFRAWMNMIFVDHGFFRMVYLNLHQISPKAWRSAQPTPYQVHGFAKRGIRTVVTLRGGQSYGSLPLEIDACREAGITFDKFVLRSRAIPSLDDLREAKAFFERIEYPVLFHCKSGADRAGMMSALYLILHEGVPVSEARKQLSIQYGHIRQGKTGILDALFDTYLADQPDEQTEFLDWAATQYDQKAITAAFNAGGMGTFLTETVLRRE